MPDAELDRHIAGVRAFNRFYTRQMGLLGDGYLKSAFSLAEARVLYELAHRDRPTASELARDLGLDAGYLSRILRRFVQRGLLRKSPSRTDRRQQHLALTRKGRRAFAGLDRASREEVGAALGPLDAAARRRLGAAMETVRHLLAPGPAVPAPVVLRPHRIGDMGWIVHRQAVLYAQEYGWDGHFEGLIAGIAGTFIETFDPASACCWIAERNGETAGSVFVVRHAKTVARLRLLYVEPSARGLGIGKRLVEEAIRFARERGYRKMILWTNDILVEARHIYEAAGFRLIAEEPHHSFGHDLVGQTWELKL